MKLFRCQSCGAIVYFENQKCERCSHRLGYMPEIGTVAALEPTGGDLWTPLAGAAVPRRFCANADLDACNWLAPLGSDGRYCLACRHNGTIPDIADPTHLTEWREIEAAKHRLFYSLIRLGLPLKTRAEDAQHGVVNLLLPARKFPTHRNRPRQIAHVIS